MGWFDIACLEYCLDGDVSFLAADFAEKVPVIGYLVKTSEGLFVSRGGSKEAKEKTVE